MLGVLPGAARFYSRPSDRCGTFKGPSFPLPRPALFFPVWCWEPVRAHRLDRASTTQAKPAATHISFYRYYLLAVRRLSGPLSRPSFFVFSSSKLYFSHPPLLGAVERAVFPALSFFVYVHAFRLPLRFAQAACPLSPFPPLWVAAASIA